MIRCPLFCVAVLVGTCALRADPGDRDDLGKDLRSLRVTLVNANAKVVTYLPVKPRVVDNQGKPQKGLSRIELGDGKGLIQGRLALVAEEDELAELEQRVQKALPGYGVKPARFESFGLRLRLGDKTVWERPVAGGDPAQIIVQGVCDGPGDPKLDGVLVWVDQVPPIDATVRFDLDKVAKTAESRFGLDVIVPLVEWAKLSGDLLESGAITVEIRGNQQKVAKEVLLPLIEKHLQRVLTDEKVAKVAPPAADEGKPKPDDQKEPPGGLNLSVGIGYRLSKAKQLRKEDETLDLRVSQPVRRTLAIAQVVPVLKAER